MFPCQAFDSVQANTSRRLLRSFPTVKTPEHATKHDGKDEHTEAERNHMLCLPKVEFPYPENEQVATTRLSIPQSTFTVDNDRPSPGGDANGDWNGLPETPVTR